MTGGEEDEMMSGEGAGAQSIAGEAAVAAVDTGGNATSSVSPANIQYDLFLPQLKISNMHSLSSSGYVLQKLKHAAGVPMNRPHHHVCACFQSLLSSIHQDLH